MKQHSLLCASLFLVGSLSSPAILASPIDFGDAGAYNVFVKENFSATSSDVEGRLAAGGDIAIANYSVNIKHGAQLYQNTNEHPALIAGGNFSFSSGQIAGNAFVGGNYSGTSSGTITNGTLTQGGTAPVDFDATFQHLSALSNSLSQLSSNGTTYDQWSTQHLQGSGANGIGGDFHIFSLDASDMTFNDYLLSDIDLGDSIIFNVSGDTINTSWGNFGGSDFSLKNAANNILFNFYEAETLNINAAMFGSILAPTADIFAPWGLIEGQIFANSWTGNAQVNDMPFDTQASSLTSTDTTTVKVSEPSSVTLLSIAILGLLSRLRSTRCS